MWLNGSVCNMPIDKPEKYKKQKPVNTQTHLRKLIQLICKPNACSKQRKLKTGVATSLKFQNVCSNQCNCFGNANACSNRTSKTRVASQIQQSFLICCICHFVLSPFLMLIEMKHEQFFDQICVKKIICMLFEIIKIA